MASFNQVIIAGNVGGDPMVRMVGDKKVAQFSVATSTGKGDKKTTSWHNIVAWSPIAEVVENYVGKGSSVMVVGMIRYRSFTDRDGAQKQVTEIMANNVQLLGGNAERTAPSSEASDDLPE